ncbi:hypothetical protein AUP68_10167 [Ilyonectria robusta]
MPPSARTSHPDPSPTLSGRRASKSTNARGRPRASLACVSCRQKKTKVGSPVCTAWQGCSLRTAGPVRCAESRTGEELFDVSEL